MRGPRVGRSVRPRRGLRSFREEAKIATGDDLEPRLFDRWRERLERGEDVDPAPELGAHPEAAERLLRGLAALRLLARSFPRGASHAPDEVPAGGSVGPYRVLARLGSGGMGTVYSAEGPDGVVALKVFHPHLLARAGFAERFRREAEIGRRIRHPNVVATHDVGEAVNDGRRSFYLAMELVEGRTLRSLVAELERVPEELCRHVGREVSRALGAIHAAGAVHRDLKPENVLITRDNVVKVMDLGVARVADESMRLSETGAFVGSILCAAPEQLGPADWVDARTDLHALGLLLYELATGVHPFHGDDFRIVLRRVLEERPRRAGELNPQISPLLEELLVQLLEKDRNRRPASALDVLRILEEGELSAWWNARSTAIRAKTRRPLRRIRIPRETSLIGREGELALLRGHFARAAAGFGRAVLVVGEAGIGKSRLVDELVLALWADGADLDFLFGSYPPGGAATATGAFSTAYREHFGDDEHAIRAALPQTPLLVPAFAALLRGDAPPADAERLTEDSLQTVFVHATRALAAVRPTVVLIDDLHFAPAEGRSLFAALARAVAGHRILLVGTSRPEIDPVWVSQMDRLGAARLPLDRLGPKDLVRLLEDALRSRHLAEELAGRIGTKSDGNPFFVFEILRALREGLFLRRRDDGTWVRTSEIREITVPSSVVELVQARISDLGPDDRNLLEAASCAGFEFDAALVGAVLGLEPIPVLQRLGAIEKAHRLVRSVGRRFAFDHHQVQEVLYSGLSEPLREAYHAAIGAALEARAAGRDPAELDGGRCATIAEHLLAGGRGADALRYLDRALDHLEGRSLNDAAVRLADRALAAPGLVDGAARAALQLRKSSRLDLLGRVFAARSAIDDALALAEASSDPALRVGARLRLGWHLFRTSRNAEAERTFRETADLARTFGDAGAEAAASAALGVVLNVIGRTEEALPLLERRLEQVRAQGDRAAEGIALSNLGNALEHLGRVDEALALQESALALARETGDHEQEVRALGSAGNILWQAGRLPEARANLELALQVARRIGDRQGEARSAGNLGRVLLRFGLHDEARAACETQVALSREIADRRGESVAIGNLGNVFTALGRLQAARDRYLRHLEISREIGARLGEAIALVNLGPNSGALGDPEGARRALEESLGICRAIGSARVEAFALHRLGDAALDDGRPQEAAPLYDAAIAVRRRVGDRRGLAATLLSLAGLRAAEGRAEDARALLAQAADLAQETREADVAVLAAAVAATLPGGDAAAARTVLERDGARAEHQTRMRAHFLLFGATRDDSHLAEARRLLDHLVAHAPPECRQAMLANVRLHREIAG